MLRNRDMPQILVPHVKLEFNNFDYFRDLPRISGHTAVAVQRKVDR